MPSDVRSDGICFFIRIITCSMQGIPRAACRRALNDEVKVGLSIAFI